MAKIKGLKLSESEVSQKINLKDLFGVSLINQSALVQAIGQAAIDKIVKRTEDGVDVNGASLKKYAKSYIESDDFKAWGKSAGEVNMTLSGQMLGTLDVLASDGNSVTIGWSGGSESAKAYNHNVGDTVTKRPFFGLSASDLDELKQQFQDEINDKLQSPRRISAAQLLESLDGVPSVSGGITEET